MAWGVSNKNDTLRNPSFGTFAWVLIYHKQEELL